MRFRAELRDPYATRETKPEQAFSVNPEELGRVVYPDPCPRQNPRV